MGKRNHSDFLVQSSSPPLQLALDVRAAGDSCGAKAPKAESAPQPSNVSLEIALLRDAQAHWQEVDRLARVCANALEGPDTDLRVQQQAPNPDLSAANLVGDG